VVAAGLIEDFFLGLNVTHSSLMVCEDANWFYINTTRHVKRTLLVRPDMNILRVKLHTNKEHGPIPVITLNYLDTTPMNERTRKVRFEEGETEEEEDRFSDMGETIPFEPPAYSAEKTTMGWAHSVPVDPLVGFQPFPSPPYGEQQFNTGSREQQQQQQQQHQRQPIPLSQLLQEIE
jgi:hypothetical protein